MVGIFWMSIVFILYTYIGYPVYLMILKKIRVMHVEKKPCLPTVSVVIAARNEENNIDNRLDDILKQDYPVGKFEIIVISDGSTDATVSVIDKFIMRSDVRLIELTESVGKSSALNHGIAASRGEIIVFTDARQRFASGAVRELVANFSDPTVGCVSGELILLEHSLSTIAVEMGAYWKYEKMIRRLESDTGSVVGSTGAIYAIRKHLFRPLPSGTLLDDVLTPLNVVMQGYRTVFDRYAVAYDTISTNANQEWLRKVRTLSGNWQLLSLEPKLLVPIHNPLLFRFLSHKIFRLLIPFAMLSSLISAMYCDGKFYQTAVIGQILFYLSALVGAVVPALREFRIINLSYFFMVMNLAALAGLWRWLSGGCTTTWKSAYAEEGRIK